MIRVGGDYQAQIPEFKPGKLRERKAGRKREMTGRMRREMWRTLKLKKKTADMKSHDSQTLATAVNERARENTET